MSNTRTVRKNSIELRNAWENAISVKSHTLDNYFIGQETEVEIAREWFDRHSRGVKVWAKDNEYTIHYDPRHFVTLTVAS